MADNSGVPDTTWARRQRLLALLGSLIGVGALALGILAVVGYPRSAGDETPYAWLAVAGAAVLLGCCVLNVISWTVAVRDWERGDDLGQRAWWQASLAAHVLSYPAVLAGMYGMLAASARAGWSSPPGVYFGLAFIAIIFAQVLGGTQRLRRSGPPGTIPAYLRQLNAKVQAQR